MMSALWALVALDTRCFGLGRVGVVCWLSVWVAPPPRHRLSPPQVRVIKAVVGGGRRRFPMRIAGALRASYASVASAAAVSDLTVPRFGWNGSRFKFGLRPSPRLSGLNLPT